MMMCVYEKKVNFKRRISNGTAQTDSMHCNDGIENGNGKIRRGNFKCVLKMQNRKAWSACTACNGPGNEWNTPASKRTFPPLVLLVRTEPKG